ncbi:MAG TPA: N-acetylmuramoyl-L-alanine amidase [Nitrospirae bacterium]|nr:N-acetylmuramoyl-L-alanine amidase [Nitrospirota bacterium]
MRFKKTGITVLAAVLLVWTAGAAFAGSKVSEIRHWSGPKYTRVVVDVEGPAKYTVNRLRSPERMFLDFSGTKLGSGKKQSVSVNDGLVGGIRSAQYDKDTVRVVLDLGGDSGYRVFSLANPTRVVIDVFKKKPESPVKPVKTITASKVPVKDSPKPAPVAALKAQPPNTAPEKSSMPAKATPPAPVKAAKPPAVASAKMAPPAKTTKRPAQAASRSKKLNIRRVVIDPGHGGRDPGAMANGLKEKHLVLDIAKRVKRELEKKGGYEVILTRSTDKFLELEERAMVANNKRADIFVSIHVNASRNRNVRGLETYILNLSTSEKSLEVAARENMVTEREMRKKRSEVDFMLASLVRQDDTVKSGVLAGKVQTSLVTNLRKRYRGIEDHKDRGAMFYVLYRAQMPSILVEVSYITNKDESRRLRSSLYRSRAAQSIAEGIDQYFKEEPDVLKLASR